MKTPGMIERLRDHWLTIDSRSVGLFRATIGIVLLLHFADRWSSSSDFYGSKGVFPATLVSSANEIPRFPTALTLIERQPFGMTVYFVVATGALAALTVGLFTRWSALLSLVVFSSLAHRNPYVLIGGDYVLGSMLLWMQVLPVGDRFSLDALRRRRCGCELPDARSMSPSRRSIAAFGVVLQLGLIYLASAWQKTGSTWWQDGTALAHVLGMQRFLRPGAELVSQLPDSWLSFLTRAVLVFEYLVLPLILLPMARPWLRRAALLGLVALHLGIAFVLDAGVFSITMLACLPLLVSKEDWDWAVRFAGRIGRPSSDFCPATAAKCCRVFHAQVAVRKRAHDVLCIEAPPPALCRGFNGFCATESLSASSAKAVEPLGQAQGRLQTASCAVTELASLWLLLGMVAANYNINFAVANRGVSLSPLDLPQRFAAAYQRWDMFTPDAPKCDPQLLVRVRMLDGRLLALQPDDESLAVGTDLAPRFRSFAWRIYIWHAILQLDPKRQAEVEPLRTELCRFITREWAATGRPAHEIFTVELWARSVPTRPLPGQPSSTAEPSWISSLDLAAERRERLAQR